MLDKGIVLVLWANHFDEVAATALATVFRKAGVRVKLVGLVHGGAMGASGLTLVPDVMLEQAISMADRAAIVIIPGTEGDVRRLDNDPRIRELLSRAHANHALFVTSVEATQEVAALVRSRDAPLIVEPYPADQGMIEFAEHLVTTLSTITESRSKKRIEERSLQMLMNRQIDCSIP